MAFFTFMCTAALLRAPTSAPVVRGGLTGRGAHHVRMDAARVATCRALVQQLADGGASKADICSAFEAALAEVFASAASSAASSAPPARTAPGLAQPVFPATITDANRAFRTAYAAAAPSAVLTPSTLKFVNVVIETSCVWGFAYSRAFAVGLAALCDTFLGACAPGEDAAAVRGALCFALGLDGARVDEDAAALLSEAAAAGSSERLLATDEFAAIAAAPGFRFTYPFGVGLVLLIRAVGETPDGEEIDRWCGALQLSCARTIERDLLRPLSVDGIGRFSFDTPGLAVPPALESIGQQGSF